LRVRALRMFVEDAVHGADRAVVDALVEQGGVDFGGRKIDILRTAQQIDHAIALWWGQLARWAGVEAGHQRRTAAAQRR